MNELKIGDVVFLKSEPQIKMTVVNIEGGKAQCVYYRHQDGDFRHTPELPMAAYEKYA